MADEDEIVLSELQDAQSETRLGVSRCHLEQRSKHVGCLRHTIVGEQDHREAPEKLRVVPAYVEGPFVGMPGKM